MHKRTSQGLSQARKRREYQLIGSVPVDAGLIWIGDPCYILHQRPLSPDLGSSWEEFCAIYYGHPMMTGGVTHDGRIPGGRPLLDVRRGRGFARFTDGVCVNTADGDGVYPVYVRYGDSVLNKNVIVELCIPFVRDHLLAGK